MMIKNMIMMMSFKRCGLHEVETSARQTSLPRCKSQQPQFRQKLLLHSRGRLARVNFKECPKPLLVCQSWASSMSLVSSELVGGCPGGCRRRRGVASSGRGSLYTHTMMTAAVALTTMIRYMMMMMIMMIIIMMMTIITYAWYECKKWISSQCHMLSCKFVFELKL